MHRARLLELELGIPPALGDDAAGGPVGGRPSRSRKLFGKVEMWHDRGLAFIYSTVFAVWSYLISGSTVMLISPEAGIYRVAIPLAFAVLVALVWWSQLHSLDKPSDEVKQLKNQIKEIEARNRPTGREGA